jgi:WD40 repeat protein
VDSSWRVAAHANMSMPPCSGPGLGHSSTVWALAFNPSGSRMVSCSDDTSLKIWYDTKGRVLLLSDTGKPHSPRCQQIAPCKCDTFTIGSVSGKLGWKLEQTLTGHHSRTVFSVDWSAADRIASCAGDNSICVYAQQQQQQQQQQRQQQQQQAVAAGGSAQAGAIAGPTGDGISALSDPASAADPAAILKTDGSMAAPVGSHHNGAAAQDAGSDRAQQQGQQQQPQQAQKRFQPLVVCPDAHAADVNCVRWHPTDHTLLASAGDDHEIKLWRLHT